MEIRTRAQLCGTETASTTHSRLDHDAATQNRSDRPDRHRCELATDPNSLVRRARKCVGAGFLYLGLNCQLRDSLLTSHAKSFRGKEPW